MSGRYVAALYEPSDDGGKRRRWIVVDTAPKNDDLGTTVAECSSSGMARRIAGLLSDAIDPSRPR